MRRNSIARCILATLILSGSYEGSVWGNGDTPSNTGPVMYAPKTRFEFGVADTAEKTSHIFTFRNTGSETLRILSVKASCGCIHHMLSGSEIQPGNEGGIEISFLNANLRSSSESVELMTNDPNNPRVVFSINVGDPVSAESSPSRIELTTEIVPFEVDSKFSIAFNDGRPDANVVSLESPSESLKIERVPDTGGAISPSAEFRVYGRLDGAALPFSGSIVIHTNSSRTPVLDLPIRVEFDAPFRALPVRALFGLTKLHDDKSVEILMEPKKDAAAPPYHADCDDGRIQVRIRSNPETPQYTVEVLLRPNGDSRILRSNVRVYSQDETLLAIIPVHAVVTKE